MLSHAIASSKVSIGFPCALKNALNILRRHHFEIASLTRNDGTVEYLWLYLLLTLLFSIACFVERMKHWFSLPCVLWTIYKFRCFFVRYVWLLVVSLNTFLFPLISLSTVMKAASGRARWPFHYSDANSVSSSELMVSKSFLPFEIGLTWFSSSRYEVVVCCS